MTSVIARIAATGWPGSMDATTRRTPPATVPASWVLRTTSVSGVNTFPVWW
jgi:hypothetical protein